MPSDRAIFKERQTGQAQTYGLANSNSPSVVVADIHRRSLVVAKTGTENAATNVAETAACVVNRAARVRSVKYLGAANVAQSTSDFVVMTISKRTAGGSATTVATYNSHNSAQGAITQYSPASFSVASNGAEALAAGDALTFTITKSGSGQAVGAGTFTVDVEEE